MTHSICELCHRGSYCRNIKLLMEIFNSQDREDLPPDLKRELEHFVAKVRSTGFDYPDGIELCDLAKDENQTMVLVTMGADLYKRINRFYATNSPEALEEAN